MDLPAAMQIHVADLARHRRRPDLRRRCAFAPLATVARGRDGRRQRCRRCARPAPRGRSAAAFGGGAAPSGHAVHLRRLRAVAEDPPRDRHHQRHADGLGAGRLLADERRPRRVKEWVDVTDADVASAIFGDYGITPADENADDDSPSHTEDGHSLMQRGSDIQFLRMLARRNGKVCRVACADTARACAPATSPRRRSTATPSSPLTLNDPTNWTVQRARPRVGRDAPDRGRGAAGAVQRHRRGRRDRRYRRFRPRPRSASATWPTFAGQPMTVLLAAPVDDAGELTQRAQGRAARERTGSCAARARRMSTGWASCCAPA